MIVSPPNKETPTGGLLTQLKSAIACGAEMKDAIKKVAKDNGVPKDVVYKLSLEIKD